MNRVARRPGSGWRRSWFGRVGRALPLLCALVVGASAEAQTPPPIPPEKPPESVTTVGQDFRARIMLGYSAVFVCLIAYLVVSHRRNASLAAEAQFLQQRLDGIRGRSGES